MLASLKNANLWPVVFSLPIIIWLALFAYSSAGVRGSDQYWYVAEVRAVMAGDPRTNSLWPNFLLADPTYLESRPFIHQGIMPHIVAGLPGMADPYMAWIIFNLVAVGLSAALIYSTLRQLEVSAKVSGLAATLFLMLPVTFWHASQPLVEITICLLSASMIAIAVRPWNDVIKFAALLVLAMIGQQIVTIFQPVLLAISVGFLWHEWRGGGTRSIRMTILYLLIAGFCFSLISLKETTLGFGVTQLMMNGTLGGSNMDLWLYEGSVPFSLSLFLGKLVANLSIFTTINSNQIFFFPFIILLIAIAFGFFIKWHAKSGAPSLLVGYIVMVALAVYGVVIALHQNQARYMVYILPVLIVAAAWLHHGLIERLTDHRFGILASGAAAMSLLSVATVLAITLRTESADSAKDSAAFRRLMAEDTSLRDAKVLIECYHGGTSLQLAYAVPDKIFIHIAPDRVATPLKRIAEISGARLIFCPADTTEAIRQNRLDLSLRRIGTAKVGPTDYEISHIDMGS
jgi:hypothetical protein